VKVNQQVSVQNGSSLVGGLKFVIPVVSVKLAPLCDFLHRTPPSEIDWRKS